MDLREFSIMKYISTRGKAPELGFEEVLIAGLASDGGLYVPKEYPSFTKEQIKSFAGLSYQELAFVIFQPFLDGTIADDDLKKIINDSYAEFRHKAIAPLKQIGNQEFILELFNGPTLAFKDFALQLLGRLFDHVLSKQQKDVVIVGATSGDTGSAAIEGCRHSRHVRIFILHPNGRVSDVQRRQMTTVGADNVFNLAVETDFDGCQNMVKSLFADQGFLGGTNLVAVNSINWARIMAQIVYYFYAALQLGAPDRKVSFSVPTGNFGDVFAGYVAKKMGLPIDKLVIATNSNDILHRFIKSNDYSKGKVMPTLSPSMDIQISSNFERLLFDLYNNDGAAVSEVIENFKSGSAPISNEVYEKAKALFASSSVNDEITCQVIKKIFEDTGEIIDPHTATGVKAAMDNRGDKSIPMVVLSTAHPVKFGGAIEKSGLKIPALPAHLADLMERQEKFEILPDDIGAVKDFISGNM